VEFFLLVALVSAHYDPTWDSLDKRPTPDWWTSSKFGIFMHWGLYAVPSYCGPVKPNHLCYAEWYWAAIQDPKSDSRKFHDRTYGEDFQYQDFATMFKLELWEPDQWAELFLKSGAKTVTMTSKHHEGFCNWPSAQSWNWNSVDNGPHRNIIQDLFTAVRKVDLKIGFYYSLYEWFHPLYVSDNPEEYVTTIMLPQMHDLINTFKPDVLYVDGEWEHDSDFWQTKPFLAWLFNDSPVKDTIAINDRWGNDTRAKHGGYYVCEYSAFKGCPPNNDTQHPWTAHEGIGGSFGYNRLENVTIYKPSQYFVHLLVASVANGGHLQLNVGPTADGRIDNYQEQVLLDMGAWLKVNGEAIYDTVIWRITGDNDNLYYTYNKKHNAAYAISTQWPGLSLSITGVTPNSDSVITMLGYSTPLKYTFNDGTLTISVPQLTIDVLPCNHAWSFKITDPS